MTRYSSFYQMFNRLLTRKLSIITLLSLLSLTLHHTCLADTHNDVVIKDLKLYVQGTEFIIKAMAYQPAPLGIASMEDEYGGTGFCSSKMTVFGEYKSACFGSDYYDGATTDPLRYPPGPMDKTGAFLPWWKLSWDRDFVKMKDLGVNTIRIYNMNPFTKAFLKLYPNEYPVTQPKRAAEHLPFLDLANKFGFKVIVPILQDESFLMSTPSDLLDKHIESQVKEMGNHPALLMFCLGNEMGVERKPDVLRLVNEKMQVVRDKMKQIHNRVVPVTHAVADDHTTYEYLIEHLKVDVFTTNAGYRNIEMEPLWTGEGNFIGWAERSKQKNLPLFIGELGMHQHSDEITKKIPDWFNRQWKSVVTHIDNGTIGACFFEYSDEINKGELQTAMGAVKFVVAKSGGKTSVQEDAWIADAVVEKPIVYQSIKSGCSNSQYQKYHFNADVYELLGRPQTFLSDYVEPTTTIDPRESPSSSASSSLSLSLSILPTQSVSTPSVAAVTRGSIATILLLLLNFILSYL